MSVHKPDLREEKRTEVDLWNTSSKFKFPSLESKQSRAATVNKRRFASTVRSQRYSLTFIKVHVRSVFLRRRGSTGRPSGSIERQPRWDAMCCCCCCCCSPKLRLFRCVSSRVRTRALFLLSTSTKPAPPRPSPH